MSSQVQAIYKHCAKIGGEMHEELNWFASFPEELKKFRGKHILTFRTCFCKKIYFCKWWIVATDSDFGVFKIIALV